MCRTRLKPPSLAKYFFAVTSTGQVFHREFEQSVTDRFGALDLRSAIFSFSDFSTYYDEELGGHTWKYLVSLNELMPVDQIVRVKHITEQVETELARHVEGCRKRTVNIDPGFLNGWQVVLASVKNHGHRLYMREGVYCEVTLLYREKAFQSLPWTYPDYQSPPVLEFLKHVRTHYAKQIRCR